MSVRLTRLVSAALISAGFAMAAHAAETTLIWRGDVTTARGVVDDTAAAWHKSGKGKIELQPFNTASGLDAVSSGAADLAGSARDSAGGRESNLVFTPVAWDSLVLITSPHNPVSNLTLKQAHDIYYGKITNWKELGGLDEAINVYAVASPGDGVEYSLRRLLFGRGNQPVAAPRLYMNTAKLEEAVALDGRSLGVSTLGDVHANAHVKVLKIDGIAASASTLASGAYPLFTPLYLVTSSSSPKVAETKAFLDFLQSPAAKQILRRHDLLPYDEGATLVAMDASRRSRILAAVGAHASSMPLSRGTELASANPAAAPAPAAAAKPVLTASVARKHPEAARAAFAAISGTAVSHELAPSLDHVTAEAITYADTSLTGTPFARLTAEVFTHKGHPLRQVAAAPATTDEHPRAPVHFAALKPGHHAAAARTSHAATRTYRVGRGDTLYSIARQHAVDVAQVRAWNGLRGNTVKTGQVLRLSAR
ncbi:LysM peptidoglycan-binding domain-containing protein [Frateuria aurantia]